MANQKPTKNSDDQKSSKATRNLLLLTCSLFIGMGGFLVWTWVNLPEGPGEFVVYDVVLPDDFDDRMNDVFQKIESSTEVVVINPAENMEIEVREKIPEMPAGELLVSADLSSYESEGTFSPVSVPAGLNFPENLLVGNDGTVLIHESGSLTELPLSDNPIIRTEPDLQSIAWNGAGDRLLLESESGGVVREVTWPEWQTSREIILPDTTQRVFWHPEKADHLWLAESEIAIDPNVVDRALWTVTSVPFPENGAVENLPDPEFRYRAFSFMGTIPQMNTAWIVDSEPNLLIPRRGHLEFLDPSSGLTGDDLTAPDSTICFSATGSARKWIVYLSAEAWPESEPTWKGVRGFIVDTNSGNQFQLTGGPTRFIAISPDGNWVSFVTGTESSWELYRQRTIMLLKDNFDNQHDKLKELREQLTSVATTLEEEFIDLKNRNPDNPEDIFSPDNIAAFSEIFEELMQEILTDEKLGLESMDQILNLTNGIWSEGDGVVYGLGSWYGEQLRIHHQTQWSVVDRNIKLGYDNQVTGHHPLLGAGPTFELTGMLQSRPAYFDLHFPYYVARERIAGRLMLTDEATDAINLSEWNTILAADKTIESVQTALDHLATNKESQAWKAYNFSATKTAAVETADYQSTFDASLGLIESNPLHPAFLNGIVESLITLEKPEVAGRLALMAFQTGHQEPETVLLSAEQMIILNEYEQAIEMLDYLKISDPFMEYTQTIDELLMRIENKLNQPKGDGVE